MRLHEDNGGVVAVLACVPLAAWIWTPDRSRSLLESRYLAAPGDMIELAGWRLHVRDSGLREAAAVILIHGFGSTERASRHPEGSLAAVDAFLRQ